MSSAAQFDIEVGSVLCDQSDAERKDSRPRGLLRRAQNCCRQMDCFGKDEYVQREDIYARADTRYTGCARAVGVVFGDVAGPE